MALSSTHMNSNLLCSVDVETTGLVPGEHEIIQIAIVPLAPDLTVSKEINLFELRIRPENQHAISAEYRGQKSRLVDDCVLHGMERWSAVKYFENWFHNTLRLIPGKRIIPLGCNYEAFDYPFLVEFFGGIESYREFFRSDVRDVQRAAVFFNDMAEWQSNLAPFPKFDLAYLCSTFNITNKSPHDAIQDAVVTAEVYRKMMNYASEYKSFPTEFFETKLKQFVTSYVKHIVQSAQANQQPMSYDKFKESWVKSFGCIQ